VVELAAASLELTGVLRLKVSGSSMLPAIRPGDVLTIHRFAHGGASAGDVVLFRREGRFFVHRILRREGAGFIARGDAARSCDPWVADSDLLGRVVSVERGGRQVEPRVGAPQKLAARVFAWWPLGGRLFTRWNASASRA
jgi:signal peptidase